MKRKIIELGRSCHVISLPSKFVERNNLKKGDEVEILDNGSNLTINAEIKPVFKTGFLDAQKYAPILRRAFDAMYKKGYDEIEVRYTTHEQLKDIEIAVANEAMTFEIVRQEKDKCIVRSITEPSSDEFDSILRRTFILIKVMTDDLLTALRSNDYETIGNIRSLEVTNNKLTHFLRRYLNKNGHSESKNTSLIYTIVEQLEKLADEFRDLCTFLAEKSGERDALKGEVIGLFDKLTKSAGIFSGLLFDFTEEKAVEMHTLKKEILYEGTHLAGTLNPRETVTVFCIINAEKIMFDLLGPIIAIKIDQEG